MNLREEIRSVIHKVIDDRNADYDDITRYIDDIIKLFEKSLEETYQSDEILGYIGNEEVHYGITLFYDKVKKEMLK